jgi:hypothetical protein
MRQLVSELTEETSPMSNRESQNNTGPSGY